MISISQKLITNEDDNFERETLESGELNRPLQSK